MQLGKLTCCTSLVLAPGTPSDFGLEQCTQEVAPDFVIPLRLYGDGADAYRTLIDLGRSILEGSTDIYISV